MPTMKVPANNLPSVATLKRIQGISDFQARQVRATLEAGLCERWDVSRVMREANRILDAHGVESIRSADDTLHGFKGLEYVNLGDPYACTLVFDYARRRFYACSWGDTVERNERRFRGC
jgi:hypothetical protein